MRYCGIDPSTTSTGIGIFDDMDLIFYACVSPKSKNWEERLAQMAIEINKILTEWMPDMVYEEDVPLKDGKPTIKKLANVQGVIRSLCALNGIEFNLLKVNEWRQNAGFYDGTKEGMEREAMKDKAKQEVEKLFGLKVNDDIAEGILIGYRSVYPIYKS